MAPKSSTRDSRRARRGSSLKAARRALSASSFIESAQHFIPSGHAGLASLETIPDLIDEQATLAVDGPGLCGALDFAFAGGGCLDTLLKAMDDVALPASDWNPEGYAEDLYLSELVSRCMGVTIDGWTAPLDTAFLTRVLSEPPADPDVAQFRRTILKDLHDDDQLRDRLRVLYRQLCNLRLCFELQDITSRFEETRHRVETLTLLLDTIETASDGFAACTSGLRRIHAFAAEAKASVGFRRLQELLEYENNLAQVDVTLQLGADGRVRKFGLMDLQENQENRFHVSATKRFFGRIGLLLRGYRFTSDELVERWLDLVFDGVKHLLPPLFQLLVHMELYLSALAFRSLCESKGLAMCFPELTDQGGRRVRGLFNPILIEDNITPVPSDLQSDTFETISVITGPNSGGKTRMLQAVGIAQLLAQGGMFVPAAEARLRPASGLFVSLIGLADPRPEKGEGRLGTELIRIRKMFENSRPQALVILDEFCSGTNPSEGEEIFYLVLTLLPELGPEVFISTHFLEFTRRLSNDADSPLHLDFLQVELDEHQRPCYTIGPGVAETSLAAQTAARLGVTREELMELIRRHQQ